VYQSPVRTTLTDIWKTWQDEKNNLTTKKKSLVCRHEKKVKKKVKKMHYYSPNRSLFKPGMVWNAREAKYVKRNDPSVVVYTRPRGRAKKGFVFDCVSGLWQPATYKQLKANGTTGADAWMFKPNVHFDTDRCALFGHRIKISKKRHMPKELAVVKRFQPCASEQFGIVFDTSPKSVFDYDLFRKSCPSWEVADWEGSIWETMELRPMCPRCGHPLDTGRAAWTQCPNCGESEPGVNAAYMYHRIRSDDPFRRQRSKM